MPRTAPQPLTVWCFTDGKAGHENQSYGLLDALRERVALRDVRVRTADCGRGLLQCIRGHDPIGEQAPDPDLIIGAGHATHLPMLNARRIRGGRVVVLMKPSLPLAWFDLCIIPLHDRSRRAGNILHTRGVLNRIRPTTGHDPGRGLILLGGPSAHVAWSDRAVLGQVRAILARAPGPDWQLATSRRTPESLIRLLRDAAPRDVTVTPAAATGPDWLPRQLAAAGQVWVTSDSVSMVYEALTSGAAVGVIEVPYRKPRHRIALALQELVREGLLTPLETWRSGQRELRPPGRIFNEAARVADWIVAHWLRAD